MEMFLAMDMLVVQPKVCRAIGRQDESHFLGNGTRNAGVCPGLQVMASVVEGGEIHEVIVAAANITPSQLCFAHRESSSLHGRLGYARIHLVMAAGDLQLEIVSREAFQVRDGDSLGARDQPVMNVAALQIIADIEDGHMLHLLGMVILP
jgi:hypothetical protein